MPPFIEVVPYSTGCTYYRNFSNFFFEAKTTVLIAKTMEPTE